MMTISAITSGVLALISWVRSVTAAVAPPT